MGFINVMFLLFGLFFIYKAIKAPNWYSGGRRGRLNAFGENAGKIDCGMLAAVLLFGAFKILWNM